MTSMGRAAMRDRRARDLSHAHAARGVAWTAAVAAAVAWSWSRALPGDGAKIAGGGSGGGDGGGDIGGDPSWASRHGDRRVAQRAGAPTTEGAEPRLLRAISWSIACARRSSCAAPAAADGGTGRRAALVRRPLEHARESCRLPHHDRRLVRRQTQPSEQQVDALAHGDAVRAATATRQQCSSPSPTASSSAAAAAGARRRRRAAARRGGGAGGGRLLPAAEPGSEHAISADAARFAAVAVASSPSSAARSICASSAANRALVGLLDWAAEARGDGAEAGGGAAATENRWRRARRCGGAGARPTTACGAARARGTAPPPPPADARAPPPPPRPASARARASAATAAHAAASAAAAASCSSSSSARMLSPSRVRSSALRRATPASPTPPMAAPPWV